MVTAFHLIGGLLIFIGAFFFVAATVGIIRMPDPYNRGHVSSKCDSPGLLLSLLGIWFYWVTISFAESLKILLIIIFMFFANPIAIHSILRLCFRSGIEFCAGTELVGEDE